MEKSDFLMAEVIASTMTSIAENFVNEETGEGFAFHAAEHRMTIEQFRHDTFIYNMKIALKELENIPNIRSALKKLIMKD